MLLLSMFRGLNMYEEFPCMCATCENHSNCPIQSSLVKDCDDYNEKEE